MVIKKENLIFDIELYPNFFLCCIKKEGEDNPIVNLIIDEEKSDKLKIIQAFKKNYYYVGYNIARYDNILINEIMVSGLDGIELVTYLKNISDRIIVGNENLHCFPKYRFIDLIKLHRLDQPTTFKGLKQLASEFFLTIEELPISPSQILTKEEKEQIVTYCHNDIEVTETLLLKSKEEIDLRYSARENYGVNEYSMTIHRPSLADKILKSYYPTIDFPDSIEYPLIQVKDIVLDKIEFKTKELQTFYNNLKDRYLSDEFEAFTEITECGLKMAKGGLHSTNISYSYISNDEYFIKDIDFSSYYPGLMVEYGFCPSHLDKSLFISVVRKIMEDRLLAKKLKNKPVAEILKIVVNSIFGATGSKDKMLFDFKVTMETTANGQLFLLMMAEMISLMDIKIIYANTDGISVWLKRSQEKELEESILKFAHFVGIDVEFDTFNKLYVKDCNNFCVLKANGEIKLKGDYASARDNYLKGFPPDIIHKAAYQYLLFDKDIDASLKEAELKDFLEGQKVSKKFKIVKEFYNPDKKIIEKTIVQNTNRYFVTDSNQGCRLYKNDINKGKKRSISLLDNNVVLCGTKEDCNNQELLELVNKNYYKSKIKDLVDIFKPSLALF